MLSDIGYNNFTKINLINNYGFADLCYFKSSFTILTINLMGIFKCLQKCHFTQLHTYTYTPSNSRKFNNYTNIQVGISYIFMKS